MRKVSTMISRPKANHMLLPSPAQIFDIGGDQKDLKLDQILPIDNQKWYLLSRSIFTLSRWSLSLERTDFLQKVQIFSQLALASDKSFHFQGQLITFVAGCQQLVVIKKKSFRDNVKVHIFDKIENSPDLVNQLAFMWQKQFKVSLYAIYCMSFISLQVRWYVKTI